MLICSYALFLLKDKCEIGRLSEPMSKALLYKILSRSPSKFHFHENNSVVIAQNLQSSNAFSSFDFLTMSVLKEWQHFFLMRACCSQQRLQLTLKSFVFVLARQTSQVVTPRSLPFKLILQSKPSIVFCNSLRE